MNINLYPPIIETYISAFTIDSGTMSDICKIPFSISPYNSKNDIKNIQITIRKQQTNLSALNRQKYPSEIKLAEGTFINDREGYVELKKEDLETGTFELNQYYKIQLRFTAAGAADISITQSPQALDSWLAANQSFFSEWSTVGIVRGISTPQLYITGLQQTEGQWILINPSLLGKISFKNSLEKEILESYQIQILDMKENLLVDSKLLKADTYNNINTFFYNIKYNLKENINYILRIKCITLHNCILEEEYVCKISMRSSDIPFDGSLSVIQEEEKGQNKISVRRDAITSFQGSFIIKRTSSETNFIIWEDLWECKNHMQDHTFKEEFYDNTIKSGVFYKYGVQKKVDGAAGPIKVNRTPSMIILEDTFLVGNEKKQLKIKFNPSISSLKRNVQESKIETIGSKFPFIKRNGNVNYVTIPIAGLISFQMDDNDDFTSKEDLFKDSLDLYESYNNPIGITKIDERIYEKFFRDQVIDFLCDGKVKLFRSTTEGNFLIRLMDISLTPENALGRMIWSFSATGYEIAEYNAENCKKYHILLDRG